MSSISSTLTARFTSPGEPPATALARWRATPPDWLDDRYHEIEDSYKSVTWEWQHTGLAMKLVGGGFFGGKTAYRLTAMFDDDGAGGSHITVNGAADKDTRAKIVAAAEQYFDGGIV